MKVEPAIVTASGVFVVAVLVSILVNPRARNPLEWMWPPTFYQRVREVLLRPNAVPQRSGHPVLGAGMGS